MTAGDGDCEDDDGDNGDEGDVVVAADGASSFGFGGGRRATRGEGVFAVNRKITAQ